MTLKSNRCSKDSYREPLLCQKKEFGSSVIKIVDSSLNSSSLPANCIYSIPDSEDGFHLNKRRKMDEEYTRDYEEHAEASVGNVLTNSVGSHSSVGNGQPSSRSSVAPCINHRIKDTWECPSPEANAAKPLTETSTRDICISILKRDIFPTKDSEPSQQSTAIAPDDNESSPLFECMRCGSMDDPSKMLICDCCEGAFHLSCCNPRVKKIPEEEWYCLVCKRKKPKRQYGKLMSPQGESPKHIQRPRQGLGTIKEMMVDAEPYESEVRIGRDFQAEVPEWSGPISSNEDQFVEPSELDPSEMAMLGCLQPFNDKKTSVSNWIQCREVLDTGVVCGKWRRAPLFVVQSSNWDCSCSVVWDPIHADCAVPQELETDEVLKQLKYINKEYVEGSSSLIAQNQMFEVAQRQMI